MTGSDRPWRGLVERDDSILLIIDYQDGFLAKLEPDFVASMVERSRFILEAALGYGVPVFVTVESADSMGGTTAPLRDLIPDVIERDKRVFGLCGQPDLRDAMLDQPRRTAVLIGMETDVCILHSAVGLKANGFRPVIVRDATGSPQDGHAFGLARAQDLGIEVIHTKGLFYEWSVSLAALSELKRVRTIAPPEGCVL